MEFKTNRSPNNLAKHTLICINHCRQVRLGEHVGSIMQKELKSQNRIERGGRWSWRDRKRFIIRAQQRPSADTNQKIWPLNDLSFTFCKVEKKLAFYVQCRIFFLLKVLHGKELHHPDGEKVKVYFQTFHQRLESEQIEVQRNQTGSDAVSAVWRCLWIHKVSFKGRSL